ncbi:WD40-repeat-containing domain protein [Chiua virens]|nr:WD40-repeat-containing domain protein [Chiua virens]
MFSGPSLRLRGREKGSNAESREINESGERANEDGPDEAIEIVMLTRTSTNTSRGSVVPTQNESKFIKIDIQGDIRSVAFREDGEQFMTAGDGNGLQVWKTESGRQVRMVTNDVGKRVFDIVVSRDRSWAVSGTWFDGSGTLTVLDVERQRVVSTLNGHFSGVYAVDVSPNGKKILTGSHDRTAVVWSSSSGKKLLTVKHDYAVFAAKFSPNGRLFAIAAWRYASIQIHDTDDGRLLGNFKIEVNASLNRSIAWHHDSKQLFALSCDGYIHHLDVSTWSTVSKWRIHSDHLPRCIIFASNFAYIAASANSSVSFWDTLTHKQIGFPIEHAHTVESVAVSANHHMVTIAGRTMTLRNLHDSIPAHYLHNTVPELHREFMNLRIRYEVHARQLRDRKIAFLTAQLNHRKKSITSKTEKLAAVRRDIDRYPDVSDELVFAHIDLRTAQSQTHEVHQQYSDRPQKLQPVIGDHVPELPDAQKFIIDSDVTAEDIIAQTVERLNADVWLSAVLITKYFVRNVQSSDVEEQASAARRASDSIGQTLVCRLERASRDNLALFLPISFRAYLNSYLCLMLSSWTMDNRVDALISYMYAQVQESESQMFAAHWRFLIRAYGPAPTDTGTLVSTVIQGLSDILVAAGCAPSTSAANAKLSIFQGRISSLILTAEYLRKSIGNFVVADFKVLVIDPSRIFDDTTMEVDDRTGRTRPFRTGRGQKILCTTRLGLIKEIVTTSPDPRQKNSRTVLTVTKAKVLLESSLPRF